MKQKTYIVTITETLAKEFNIEAVSKGEAEKIIREKYLNFDIVLSAEDLCSIEIEARENED